MKPESDRDGSAEAIWAPERLPILALAPRRRIVCWQLLLPAGVLAILFGASHTLWHMSARPGAITATPAAVAPPPEALLPAQPDRVTRTAMLFPPFPKNGTAIVNLPRGIARPAGVTLETGATDAGAHWVVSLHGWASGAWRATLYLDADSVTTLFLPAGAYRVDAAAGDVWQGDIRLFGDETLAVRFTQPVRLSAGPSQGRLILLPPAGNGATPVPVFTFHARG